MIIEVWLVRVIVEVCLVGVIIEVWSVCVIIEVWPVRVIMEVWSVGVIMEVWSHWNPVLLPFYWSGLEGPVESQLVPPAIHSDSFKLLN